jgi:hypothetical protein
MGISFGVPRVDEKEIMSGARMGLSEVTGACAGRAHGDDDTTTTVATWIAGNV